MVWNCMSLYVRSWQGKAMKGMAWLGKTCLGIAWKGKERKDRARHRMAWQGMK
jgi:hypothetical protein